MEDRRASMVAAAFGSVAIGGFWLARPAKALAPLRVVEQWVPVVRSRADDDAAVAFRVDFSKGIRAAQDEGRTVDYRVIDRSGNQYALIGMADPNAPDALKLQRGYVHPILSPRLAAYSGVELLASVPIAPLPPPERIALKPRPDAEVALVYHPGAGILAEPKRPLARDERWRVVARRSPSNGHIDSGTIVSPRRERIPYRRLSVPYPWDVTALDVEIVRYRLLPRSDVVHVPNLRLERRFGGTALIVDERVNVPNGLNALVYAPVQDNGPRRPLRRNDPLVAFASLLVSRAEDAPASPLGPRREIGPYMEILAPNPESLGLKELRIGGAVRRAERTPAQPVREGPFTATVRITYYRPVPVSTRRAVIPVTNGPAIRFVRGDGFGMNSSLGF